MVIASKNRARRQNTIALPVHADHPNSPNSDQCKLKAARARHGGRRRKEHRATRGKRHE